MACITVSFARLFKQRLLHFPWVNWSEVGRENSLKKEIFDMYIKTGVIFEEDLEFCESIDWHPVDELPLKKEFIKELLKVDKEISEKIKSGKLKSMTTEEFERWCDSL